MYQARFQSPMQFVITSILETTLPFKEIHQPFPIYKHNHFLIFIPYITDILSRLEDFSMNTISIAIVGGDLRFVRLAQLMAEKNMDVRIYGITHPDIPESVKVCHALSDICECQYIIGPIPFSQDSKSVFTPLSNIYIPIEQYMVYAANSYSIVGALKKDIKLLFEKHHLKYKDLMDLDEVAILNAIPTQVRMALFVKRFPIKMLSMIPAPIQ